MNVVKRVKSINQDAVKRCTEYIKENYDFKQFLIEHNLLSGAVTQGNNWLITCPFHYDAYPSMSIDLEGHRFKCFSCNLHGNMLTFMLEYNIGVLGNNYNFYDFLELLLKNDVKMQIALGLQSIYITSLDSFKQIEFKPKKLNLDVDTGYPETFTALVNQLLRQKADTKTLVKMISLMQLGFSVKEVYEELMQNKEDMLLKNTKVEKLDISDILNPSP